MNKFILKPFAMLLAIILLAASSGFSANAHYCSDKLHNISLWGNAETCIPLDEQESEGCANTMSEKQCCSTQDFFCKANINASAAPKYSHQITFQAATLYTLPITDSQPSTYYNFILKYNPSPPTVNSLSVLYQNFRI